MTEQEIRSNLRIISDPSHQVQSLTLKGWITIFYCADGAVALRKLEDCVQRRLAWVKMCEEDRINSILRGK